MAAVKINITVKDDLLKRIDEFADDNGMTRSGLFSLAVRQYLDAQEMTPQMKDVFAGMVGLLGDFASGKVSKEDAIARNDAIGEVVASMKARFESPE